MLKEIEIVGFKRFKRHRMRLTPLTVLAGVNGAGKTSVIHSLLLAKEISANVEFVRLNGPFGIELGTFEDIQNWDAPETVSFGIMDDEGINYAWTLNGEGSNLFARISARPLEAPAIFSGNTRMFQYLCAERLGPRSVLGSSILPSEKLDVGFRGEYSAQVLYSLGSTQIDSRRRYPGEIKNEVGLLKVETERWMSAITRNIQIDTEMLPGTSVTALKFRFGDDWVRPPNTGFGVTYSLPIIIAALSARSSGLLIVENPEAHLHPAGQSQMGIFLATVASTGVQVIVETHSDHLLNGVRRAIGERGILEPEEALVHFFMGSEEISKELCFTHLGGLSSWPKGFADQFSKDVSAITRIRRPTR